MNIAPLNGIVVPLKLKYAPREYTDTTAGGEALKVWVADLFINFVTDHPSCSIKEIPSDKAKALDLCVHLVMLQCIMNSQPLNTTLPKNFHPYQTNASVFNGRIERSCLLDMIKACHEIYLGFNADTKEMIKAIFLERHFQIAREVESMLGSEVLRKIEDFFKRVGVLRSTFDVERDVKDFQKGVESLKGAQLIPTLSQDTAQNLKVMHKTNDDNHEVLAAPAPVSATTTTQAANVSSVVIVTSSDLPDYLSTVYGTASVTTTAGLALRDWLRELISKFVSENESCPIKDILKDPTTSLDFCVHLVLCTCIMNSELVDATLPKHFHRYQAHSRVFNSPYDRSSFLEKFKEKNTLFRNFSLEMQEKIRDAYLKRHLQINPEKDTLVSSDFPQGVKDFLVSVENLRRLFDSQTAASDFLSGFQVLRAGSSWC